MPQSHRSLERPVLLMAMAGSPTAAAYALLVAILAALFGSSLVGVGRLAFRDCGHFYTPLYHAVAEQERTQWLPLHNPLDVTGMPLAGETTTALFYPPRRAVYYFAASGESALAWYVVLHLLLAGAAVHYAAAAAGASAAGRACAILAYPLSGPILFLYSNPPFLVGAAWIPLALAGGYRLLRGSRMRDLAVASIGLAMPILGGDPQVSIHVMLIGLAALVGVTITRASAAPAVFLRLAAAVFLAVLLAGPQIAGSVDWANQSTRYAASDLRAAGEVYHFSVAPWHWLELVAPSLSGRLFPVYTRISHLIVGDGQTWATTLYAGLIPLALALTRYRYTRWRELDLWDSLAPIGLLFALGSFGLGYLVKISIPFVNLRIEDAAGGPYWWLVTFMPGYSGFRYPAKWLVFVPLGIAVAAARQSSRWSPARWRRLSRTCFILAAMGLAMSALVVILLYASATRAPYMLNIADSFWGPLQWSGAAAIVASSALTVTAIAAVAFWICRGSLDQNTKIRWLLVLIAIDLAVVAWPTVAVVNRAAEAQLMLSAPAHDADQLADASPRHSSDFPAARRAMRFAPGGVWPAQWRTVPSPGPQRMLLVEASMRNSRYGRWHLVSGHGVFNPVTSLPPHRAGSFWQAANALAGQQKTAPQQALYWDRVMGFLAVDNAWTVIAPQKESSDDDPDETRRLASELVTLRITATRSPAQRVVWSRAWRAIDHQKWVSGEAFAVRLAEVASDDATAPLVEIPLTDRQRAAPLTAAEPAVGSASILAEQSSPDRLRITVDAPTRGLLCIKQFQDGNWRGTIRQLNAAGSATTAAATDIYRCDYLFSAVMLPAGRSEVMLAYQPQWLVPSLALAALGWLAAAALLLNLWPRRRTTFAARRPAADSPQAGTAGASV